MLGIDEMPALDFGFLFFALAFSSIFLRWLKGTTPLQIGGKLRRQKMNSIVLSETQVSSSAKILIRDRTKVKSDFHSPPVEAVLQLSTRVESAALQWYHTFSLEFRESLSTVLQLRGHRAQGVIHPGCHLHNTHRTQLKANNSVNRFVSCWNYKWATTHIQFPGPGTVHLIKKNNIFYVISYFCYKHRHRP